MAYFSRLTDIVTCNLTEILSRADDPRRAIEDIIREMDEGLAGAKRSVANATASEQRIHGELEEQRAQAALWASKAKSELRADNEDRARLALVRKQEVEDVIAGLKQQQQAAISTREHLTTALHALEAR
jgi:phage shock protein A